MSGTPYSDPSDARATWSQAPESHALQRWANRNDLVHAALTVPELLTSNECTQLVKRGRDLPAIDGTTHRNDQEAMVRRVVERVLPMDDDYWPWKKVLRTVADLNASHFRFEVDDLGCPQGPPRLLTYEAGRADRYRPHLDIGPGMASRRKLTWILQLCRQDEYRGGRLRFAHSDTVESCDQGALIVFPAYLAHEVTEVTEGVRHSVVGWAHGPSFR